MLLTIAFVCITCPRLSAGVFTIALDGSIKIDSKYHKEQFQDIDSATYSRAHHEDTTVRMERPKFNLPRVVLSKIHNPHIVLSNFNQPHLKNQRYERGKSGQPHIVLPSSERELLQRPHFKQPQYFQHQIYDKPDIEKPDQQNWNYFKFVQPNSYQDESNFGTTNFNQPKLAVPLNERQWINHQYSAVKFDSTTPSEKTIESPDQSDFLTYFSGPTLEKPETDQPRTNQPPLNRAKINLENQKTIQLNSLKDLIMLFVKGLNYQNEPDAEPKDEIKKVKSPNVKQDKKSKKNLTSIFQTGFNIENINLGIDFKIDSNNRIEEKTTDQPKRHKGYKILKSKKRKRPKLPERPKRPHKTTIKMTTPKVARNITKKPIPLGRKNNTQDNTTQYNSIQFNTPKYISTNINNEIYRTTGYMTADIPVTNFHRMIHNIPRKIGEDPKISQFLDDIQDKTKGVFTKMMNNEPDPVVRKDIRFVARNYARKIKAFIKETKGHQIKTRAGPNKVMLNTIEYSHNIINRLINYLIVNTEKSGAAPAFEHGAALRTLKSEVLRQLAVIECESGMCPPKRGFHRLVMDILTILIATDERRARQAFDALEIVLKASDFSDTVSGEVYEGFMEKVSMLQRVPSYLIKPSLLAVRNSLERQNKPINAMQIPMDRVNRTSAFLAMIDSLSTKLDSLDNIEEKTDKIRQASLDWASDKRQDIGNIVFDFINLVKMGTLLHKGKSSEVANDLLGKVVFSEETFRRWLGPGQSDSV